MKTLHDTTKKNAPFYRILFVGLLLITVIFLVSSIVSADDQNQQGKSSCPFMKALSGCCSSQKACPEKKECPDKEKAKSEKSSGEGQSQSSSQEKSGDK